MSQQDDPEARIRELEHSLSDHTSELTRSSAEEQRGGFGAPWPPPPPAGPPPGYGAPPPPYGPPQPPYGVPYAPAPTTGGRPGRSVYKSVAFAVAIGVTAFVVFFAFGFVKSFLAARSGEQTVSGGGGSIAPLPGPSMVTIPTAPVAEPSASSAPQGSEVSVSGVGENKTIECNDAAVAVSGVSNTVVLTGHCASVMVSGVENVVTVDSADVIGASGLDNRVTFHAGAPEIQNTGESNVVEQG